MNRKTDLDIDGQTLPVFVTLDKLFVDKYARGASEVRVKYLVANWDDQSAGSIILSLRESEVERYAVLDGWHRVCAARALGKSGLWGLAYIDLTYQREAELFSRLNSRLNVTPLARFRSDIEAGNETALRVLDVVRSVGLDIAFNSGARGCIRSVIQVQSIFTRLGAVHLAETLSLLKDGLGVERDVISDHAIGGMSAFLQRYTDAQRPRIVSRLEIAGHLGMRQRMTFMRSAVADTPGMAWGRALRELYNHGLQDAARLPEWRQRVFSERGKEAIGATARETLRVLRERGHDFSAVGRESAEKAKARGFDHSANGRRANVVKAAKRLAAQGVLPSQ